MWKAMVLAVFLVLMLGLAAPAWAQDDAGHRGVCGPVRPADVPEGQTVGDLVVFHGSATVDGTVEGSLTAFDAPVTISGRVNGDVVVFNGRVELESGANVTGDVVSQQAPVVASGATIGGTTRRLQTNINWEGFGWAGNWPGGWPSRCRPWWSGWCCCGWSGGRGRILEAGPDPHRPVDRIGAAAVLRPPPPGRHRAAHCGRDPARPRPAGRRAADPCPGLQRQRPGSWAGRSSAGPPPGSCVPPRVGDPAGGWPWSPSSAAWPGSPPSCSAWGRSRVAIWRARSASQSHRPNTGLTRPSAGRLCRARVADEARR